MLSINTYTVYVQHILLYFVVIDKIPIIKMSTGYQGHSTATNPQFASPNTPGYSGGFSSATATQYGAVGPSSSIYGQGNATSAGGTYQSTISIVY